MTPTEMKLAQIYTDFLSIPNLSAEDDIYELGADSMLVVRVALELEREFGIEMPTEIFEDTGTIRNVAAWIDQAVADKQPPAAKLRAAGDLDV